MKVSELISRLIALKVKHGNLEVLAGDPDYGEAMFPVTGIREDQGTIDIYHFEGSHCKQCGRGCD